MKRIKKNWTLSRSDTLNQCQNKAFHSKFGQNSFQLFLLSNSGVSFDSIILFLVQMNFEKKIAHRREHLNALDSLGFDSFICFAVE